MDRLAFARRCLAGLALFLGIGGAVPAHAQSGQAAALLRQHAEAGTLGQARAELATRVEQAPADAEARAALGFAQFALSIERLGHSLYRHGLQPPQAGFILPVLRFPVPVNANPEPITYEKMRAIYQRLLDDLAEVDATLAALPSGEFKLKINLNAVALDLDGDGRGSPAERLGVIVRNLMATQPRRRPGQMPAESVEVWNVAFDRADAIWLRGYGRLLAAFSEFVLAHDWRDTFNATAEVVFPRVEGGLGLRALALTGRSDLTGVSGTEASTIADAFALVHMLRFPVIEPERMKRVRQHLIKVIALSRENWKTIMAETDDEDEWLPSPKQKNAAVSAMQVSDTVVTGWLSALDTFEQVLEGKLLLGHWRFSKGIDLKAVFEEPRAFDLILWITGQAAVPYLKDGPTTSSDTIGELQRSFGGNFLGFAIWFN